MQILASLIRHLQEEYSTGSPISLGKDKKIPVLCNLTQLMNSTDCRQIFIQLMILFHLYSTFYWQILLASWE